MAEGDSVGTRSGFPLDSELQSTREAIHFPLDAGDLLADLVDVSMERSEEAEDGYRDGDDGCRLGDDDAHGVFFDVVAWGRWWSLLVCVVPDVSVSIRVVACSSDLRRCRSRA